MLSLGYRWRFFPATILIALSMAHAQSRHEYSVKQCIEYSIKNSITVKNALLGVRIQRQTNREVTSALFPQVSGSANGTNYLNIPTTLLPGEFVGQPPGTFVPIQFGTKYNFTYGITITQMLFDGQLLAGLQARGASLEYARQTAAITLEQIKANIHKLYYQLVAGKKQLASLDANIVRAEKLLHDTKKVYENGFQEKLDIDRATVTLSNARTEKLKMENQLHIGVIGLKYLIGMPVSDELILIDTCLKTVVNEYVFTDSITYENRKEYQRLRIAERLGKLNVRRYTLRYLPSISLSGSYSRTSQGEDINPFRDDRLWFTASFFSLNMAVPVFSGFAGTARVKKARLELLQTQNAIADLITSIQGEVQTARNRLRSARQACHDQETTMTLAEKVYNQTKKKYEAGVGSGLEVAGAETELKSARSNYYAALYDVITATVDYLKATGRLQ